MDAMLLFAGILIVPMLFALLAVSFGEDSRPAYPSSEFELAKAGVNWHDVTHAQPQSTVQRRVRLTALDTSRSYPILTMLDRARRAPGPALATDAYARQLEVRARELADEFIPNSAWLTGLVSPELIDAVTMHLEQERQALQAEDRSVVAGDSVSRQDRVSA